MGYMSCLEVCRERAEEGHDTYQHVRARTHTHVEAHTHAPAEERRVGYMQSLTPVCRERADEGRDTY